MPKCLPHRPLFFPCLNRLAMFIAPTSVRIAVMSDTSAHYISEQYSQRSRSEGLENAVGGLEPGVRWEAARVWAPMRCAGYGLTRGVDLGQAERGLFFR